MTHQEIEKNEVIERYVRHQLSPDERRAFQEHYFACEECFEAVQATARFIAGVREASRKGALATEADAGAWWAWLFRPAPAAALAMLLLAAAIGWFYFGRPARPARELARESAPTPSPAAVATPAPTAPEPERPHELLARNHVPEELAPRLPAVLLESSRGGGGAQIALAEGVRSVVLRIEVEPDAPFGGYRFQVLDRAKRVVATASAGKAGGRGAVAATLPAQDLQSGTYLVRWYGLRDGQQELIGESELTVRRP